VVAHLVKISSWTVAQHLRPDKGERDYLGPWLSRCSLDGSLRAEISLLGWLAEKLLGLDGILHGLIHISNVQDTIAVDRWQGCHTL
jgi:hypothetical protein